jgi:hypothetical protein
LLTEKLIIMTIIIKKESKRADIEKALSKGFEDKESKSKGFDAKKYCGVIKSFKGLDPNKIQENLRNEW